MSILLDTKLLLWSQVEPSRLPQWIVERLDDPDETPIFSVVSIWEVIIKAALKRKDFDFDAAQVRTTLLEKGWRELELRGEHVLGVGELGSNHGDPFDRVLVAQAKADGRELGTTDAVLKGYGSHVRIVKGRKLKR
jgi:PIN domain nuclease of toxin-antitoxin system